MVPEIIKGKDLMEIEQNCVKTVGIFTEKKGGKYYIAPNTCIKKYVNVLLEKPCLVSQANMNSFL